MKLPNWLALTSPLLLLIVACGGGTGSGGTGSGGAGGHSNPTTTTGTGGGPAACTAASLCLDVHYTDPCTIRGASSGTGGSTGEYTADDVAAAECLLTKMRAHEVGTAKIFHGVGQLGCQMDGVYVETHLVGLGDGNVSTQDRTTGMISPTEVTMPQLRALKLDAFFDDCLAAADPGDKVRCVLDMTGAVAAGEPCPTFWP